MIYATIAACITLLIKPTFLLLMCTIVGVSYSKKILTTFKKPGWTMSFALGMARIMFTWLKCLMTVGQVSIVVHQSSEPMPGWGRSLLAEIERVSHEFILARLSRDIDRIRRDKRAILIVLLLKITSQNLVRNMHTNSNIISFHFLFIFV